MQATARQETRLHRFWKRCTVNQTREIRIRQENTVILSGAVSSRSEDTTESKDPYTLSIAHAAARRSPRAVSGSSASSPTRCGFLPLQLLRPTRLPILLQSQFPGSLQRSGQHILARRGQPNMSGPHPSPPAMNGKKKLRHLLDKCRLLFGCQHQIPVTLLGGSQRGKDSSAHAEVGRAHVRPLFRPFQAKRYSPKITNRHAWKLTRSTTAAYPSHRDPDDRVLISPVILSGA